MRYIYIGTYVVTRGLCILQFELDGHREFDPLEEFRIRLTEGAIRTSRRVAVIRHWYCVWITPELHGRWKIVGVDSRNYVGNEIFQCLEDFVLAPDLLGRIDRKVCETRILDAFFLFQLFDGRLDVKPWLELRDDALEKHLLGDNIARSTDIPEDGFLLVLRAGELVDGAKSVSITSRRTNSERGS